MITNRKTIKKFNTVIFFLNVLMILSFALSFTLSYAVADTISNSQVSLFMPETSIEYKKLTSPISAYIDGDVTAIVENNDTFHSITIKVGDKILENPDKSDSSLNYGSVKIVNDKTVFFVNGSQLYSVDLTKDTFEPVIVSNVNSLGVTYFDTFGDFLVTSNNNLCAVFKLKNNEYVQLKTFECKQNGSPVAINPNGQIFYLNENKVLCMLNANNIEDAVKTFQNTEVSIASKFIADNDYLYFIKITESDGGGSDIINKDNAVHKINISDGTHSKLAVKNIDNNYNLGQIKSPVDISFCGNDFIITDNSLNAIQKFSVNNELLNFTGFAVASEKTAYNRITKNAVNIEKYGDKIAVLDDNKLSVITLDNDIYNSKNYSNFHKEKLGGEMPLTFALGKDFCLLGYSINTSSSYLKFLSLSDGRISDSVEISSGNVKYIVRDICYQSGYFYALCDDGGKPAKIYVISEEKIRENMAKTENIDLLLTPLTQVNDSVYSYLTVDALNNIYLASDSEVVVLKPSENGSYEGKTLVKSGANTITKMETDLSGGLFVLEDTLKYFNGTDFVSVVIDHNNNLSSEKIKSFAMDFITDSVFFIYDNAEYISVSENIPVISMSNLSLSDEFIINDKSTNIDNLKIYHPIKNANVYTINNKDNTLNYVSIIKSDCDYVYICDITFTSPTGRTLTMLALAGQDSMVLAEKSQVQDVTESQIIKSVAPSEVYVTTNVNGYYFPIITEKENYVLVDNEKIKLNKLDKIKPVCSFSFLDLEYYYAEFTVNNKTYMGYVPKSFTVEVLSEDFKWNDYTTEYVSATPLYSDSQLTEKIKDLSDGTVVKVIETTDNYIYVAVNGDDGYTTGYIMTNVIKNKPVKAVRNIIIIVAVSLCVLSTCAFFVARKKKN